MDIFVENYVNFVIDDIIGDKTKIRKGSKTTYGDWCDKHNIE